MRTGVLCLIALVVLGGCGGDTGGERGTRAYRDAKGQEVRLPDRPRRVIALSEPTLDGALALGVRPIATTSGRGQTGVSQYLVKRAAGIPSVGILGQPNIERIAELGPDLILVDGTSIQDDAILGKLKRIAPTVFVSRTAQDWRTAFAAEAQALGLAARGRSLLAAFDRRAEAIRRRLGASAGATVSVVRWGGVGLPSTILQELAVSRVLRRLGLRRPPLQARRGPGHSVPVSLENLDQLDGDWMFFASLGEGGPSGGAKVGSAGVRASRAALALAERTPGFTALRAHRRRRVVPVDGSAWTSAGGLLAETVVLDDVERTLVP